MPQISLPPQFKEITGLGQAVKSYTQSFFSRAWNIIGCLIILALGGYLLVDGVFFYPQRFPDVASTNAPFMIGLGGLFLIGAIFWARKLITRWHEILVVFEKGFAHAIGENLQIIRWEEITSIAMQVIKHSYYGIPAGTQRKYWIHKQSGEVIKLDGEFSNPDDFIDRVRAGANPFIYAMAIKYFEAGQLLQFGPIAISRSKGIVRGKKEYPWSTIGRITVDRGTMWVEPLEKNAFKKFSVPVVGMPDFDILLAIAAEMAQRQN